MTTHRSRAFAAVSALALTGCGIFGSSGFSLQGQEGEARLLVAPEPEGDGNDILTQATISVDLSTDCVIDESSGIPIALPDGSEVSGSGRELVIKSGTAVLRVGDQVHGRGSVMTRQAVDSYGDEAPTRCGPPPWNVVLDELNVGPIPD